MVGDPVLTRYKAIHNIYIYIYMDVNVI